MIQKLAASDNLESLQVKVISEFEGLLNVSMRKRHSQLANLQFDFHNGLPLKIKIKIYLVLS